MIVYPVFVAAVAERDLEALAVEAGVPVAVILDALADCGYIIAKHHRQAIADALGIDAGELFRAISQPSGADLEPTLAAAPARFVSDPATLRAIER